MLNSPMTIQHIDYVTYL